MAFRAQQILKGPGLYNNAQFVRLSKQAFKERNGNLHYCNGTYREECRNMVPYASMSSFQAFWLLIAVGKLQTP